MRPLAPIALSFILGLVSARYLNPTYGVIVPLILLCVVFNAAASIRKWRLAPAVYLPLFFLIGVLFLLPVMRPQISGCNIKNFINHGIPFMRVEGLVYGAPEGRKDSTGVYVEAKRVFTDGAWKETEGSVFLTVEGRPGIRRGDIIRFMSSIREPRNFNNPGEFDYEWRLKTKGVDARGYVKEGFFVRVKEGSGFLNAADNIRESVGAFIDSSQTRNRAIIKALVTGEKADIPDDIEEAFIRSGTAHLLSISGLHVGFVAYLSYLFFFWIFRRSQRLILSLNVKKLAWAVSLVPVLFYGMISGLSTPSQRAVIMVAALVITILMGRARELYNTIALAALLILALSPGALWEGSFQLSFASVLSMVYLVPTLTSLFESPDSSKASAGGSSQGSSWVMRGVIRGGRRWAGRGLSELKIAFFASVAATLGTYSILAYNFHRVSVIAVFANIFVIPPVGFLAVPMGFISAMVFPFSRGLSIFILRGEDLVLDAVVWLIRFFSGLPYASLWVTTPTLIEIIIFYAIILCVPSVRERRRGAFLVLLFFETLFLTDKGYLYYKGIGQNVLKVTYLSVGQGDSMLVEFPSEGFGRGKRMLIDGGGFPGKEFDTGEGIVAPYLWKKKIGKVDYIVLTHQQRDHMEGLKFIAKNFGPVEFWWNGAGSLPPALNNVLAGKGIRVVRRNSESPGMVIGGVKIDFLNPPGDRDFDTNNSSLVLKLTYGNKRFLFTGDIGKEAEETLSGKDIRADIIKVPHHGSRFSSTPAFLERVNPQIAVVSAGWLNPFGFPHKETEERYKERGIRLYSTVKDGAITVETDGVNLGVKTYLTKE